MLYMGIWCCIGVYGVVYGYMVLYRGIWCCIGVYSVVYGYMMLYNQSLGFSLPIAWSLPSNGLSVSAHKTFLFTYRRSFICLHSQ